LKFNHSTGEIDAQIDELIVAGWTGRDTAAVAHHIRELQDIGVAPPSQTPLFYRVSRTLLTQDRDIQVLGASSSGEAEPLLLRHDGTLWLGLASDHTDREMEAMSVVASKQACPKVCADTLWLFDEVAAHLDALILRSWIKDEDDWILYQDGTLSSILPLGELADQSPFGNKMAMLCGTLAALGGIRSAQSFRAELHDPILERSIFLEYQTRNLPIIN
jgi:hypothetical protein